MSDRSSIEWTDATWNWARGCREVSPGCARCYAKTFSERFRGVEGHPFEQGFDPRMVPEALGIPASWSRPRRIFVNSMSDTFLDTFHWTDIRAAFRVMEDVDHHTYQVLTKRAKRMRRLINIWFPDAPPEHHGENGIGPSVPVTLPRHIWLGVSVENRKHGIPRIDDLRATNASMRWLSIEPLLEDLGSRLDLTGISWVVVGGESGPGARPFDLRWGRRIVAQCQEQGIPVFFKQVGARPITGFYDDFREEYENLHKGIGWPMPEGWTEHDGQPLGDSIVRLATPVEVIAGKRHRDTKGKLMRFWPPELRVREFPR